jgi:predicted DNA-binding transcriptional regulator YafY
MERTERFYRIQQLLRDRRVVPFTVFLEQLEVSRATVKRDLEYLRNRMNAPIAWDPEARGYRFAAPEQGSAQYELPGLWFNASEIHALLTMRHLLAHLEPGIIAPHLAPIGERLALLLGSADHSAEEVQKRVRILGMAARRFAHESFAVAGSALLRRKRLHLRYHVRARDEVTEREVSPQRLVYYRDNWYLDAWCHRRDDLRSFAIDAIRDAEILDKKAREIPESTLNRVLGAGYGIFSGQRVRWGRLRFTPERARWVAAEEWHPRQRGRFEADGSYVLEIPYSDDRELVMDILRHGPEVEVLGPATLRGVVRERLAATLARYQPRRSRNRR